MAYAAMQCVRATNQADSARMQRVPGDHCRGLTRYRTKESIQQWQDDALVQGQLKTSVETVLRLMYEEHFEVPFIAMHRKEVSRSP